MNTNIKHLNIIQCRCCLNKEHFESFPNDYYDDKKRKTFEDMLENVFNIQISYKSKLSDHYMCNKCITRLLDASMFKKMVLENYQIFMKNLNSIHEKGITVPDHSPKSERIKLEVSTVEIDSNNMDHIIDDDDDDEILANLKSEIKNADISAPTTNLLSKPCLKSKKTRKKVEKNDKISSLTKLIEHRGNGPILRLNSLKLLNHSSAAVFQWNKSRYRCFCCKEPFSDIDKLRAHTSCHSLEEIQKTIINQRNQLIKVEISNLNCKVCNKELNDLDDLKVHLIDHNIEVDDHLLVPFKIESKLKCQICLEPFNLFRLLNIHMNKHYQKHVCYVCGAGFSNLVFLNLHRTRSHRPIHCEKCDLNFETRTAKKQHNTEVHGLKTRRGNRYPCPFCSERFSEENLRVVHLVEKHGLTKPEFVCQFCSKTFITKSLVNNHVKAVHMKEKNHECDVCHKLFYTKSDVARHRVTHTKEKNYTCTLCSNPFASKDSLRRHLKRTHFVQ